MEAPFGETSAADIIETIDQAEAEHNALSSEFAVKAWRCIVLGNLELGDFEKWVAALLPQQQTDSATLKLVQPIPKERHQALVAEEIMQTLVERLRLASQSAEVKCAALALRGALPLIADTEFADDLGRFISFATVDEVDLDDIAAVRAAMRKVLSCDLPSRFQKPLRLFPTGIEIVSNVERVFTAHEADKKIELHLTELEGLAWDALPFEPGSGIASLSPDDYQKFSRAAVLYRLLKAKMSPHFAKKHHATLDAWVARFSGLATTALAETKSRFTVAAAKSLEQLSTAVQSNGKAAIQKSVEELATTLSSCLPAGGKHPLSQQVDSEVWAEFEAWSQNVSSWSSTVVKASPSLCDDGLFVDDANVVKLLSVVEARDIQGIAGEDEKLRGKLQEFYDQVVAAVVGNTSTHLKTAFRDLLPFAHGLSQKPAAHDSFLSLTEMAAKNLDMNVQPMRLVATALSRLAFGGCPCSSQLNPGLSILASGSVLAMLKLFFSQCAFHVQALEDIGLASVASLYSPFVLLWEG